MVAAEQIGPGGIEIGAVANARDLGGNLEQGVGHLAGDDIDLVRLGDRDQHVGVLGAGLHQHVGMRGVAQQRLHVEGLTDLLDTLARMVDDHHVVVLGGKMTGDVQAHLAHPADQHFHFRAPLSG